MNRFEQMKAGRDLATLASNLELYAQRPWQDIPKEDLECLKVLGLAIRPKTPGYFMIRVRIPGGRTNAAHLRALASIARDFGRGLADITTRAQLQLRWIQLRDIPVIIHRLHSVGLLTSQTLMDSVRNISGCPLTGLTGRELVDASSVIESLEHRIVDNPELLNLPRKVNIAITGCTADCCKANFQDIALVPAVREENTGPIRGFNLLVGGKTSGGDCRPAQPLDVFLTPDQAASAVEQVLYLYRDHGPRQTRSRSRLAYLLEAWGLPRFRQELQLRMGRPLTPAGHDARNPTPCHTVGLIPQKDPDLFAAGLHVPVGRLTAEQLENLASLAATLGTGDVRLTSDQNVLIPHIPRNRLLDLRSHPVLSQLQLTPHPLVAHATSCTGAEYCAFAAIETKGRAVELAEELARRLPHAPPLRIAWSGCRAGCGQHMIADIGLLGRRIIDGDQTIDAVDVYLGGSTGPTPRAAEKVLDAVPCDQLADTLEGLIRSQPDRFATTTPNTEPAFD